MSKEEILNKNGLSERFTFTLNWNGIIKSMSDYSASLIKENQELKAKVRELEARLTND